ncbi:MAG: hypothetical protein R2774_15880 [Saprospiraceae bacterium]
MYRLIILTLVIFFAITSCKNSANSEKGNIQSTSSIDTSTIMKMSRVNLDSVFSSKDGYYMVPWSVLTKVDFEKSYVEKMDMEMTLPVFNDTIKALDHANVEIEGFYIPVDETGDDKIVILSAYPFAQCFFCGKAGVESIIDILPKASLPTLKVDRKLRFRGKLKLNRDDFDYLIYILEEAILVD